MRTRADKIFFVSLTISLALLLTTAGCGGGNSSPMTTTASPTPPPPSAPPPAPPPTPTPTPPPVPVTPTEFLYAAVGQKADINGYSIDMSNGHLTLIAGSPFTVVANGQQAQTCTVGCGRMLTSDPLGKFLFDAYMGSPTPGVVSFAVNPTSGALTQADFKTPPSNNLTTDPMARFLYGPIGDFSHPAVQAFDINRANGTLAPAPGSPYSYPPQGDTNIAPAVSNLFAYTLTRCNGATGCVGNDVTSHINGFSIDQMTGALTPLANSPFTGGQLMQGLALHPAGKFLYSEEEYLNGNVFDNEIVGFQINSDGSLTRLSSAPAQTPDNGVAQLLVSPNGSFLYHTANGHVRAYTIDQNTGALTLTGIFQPVGNIAIDPTVKFVFSTQVMIQGGQAVAQNAINVYTVDPLTGAITAIPDATVMTTETPAGLAVDKTQ